jgi:transposase-like protein
MKCPKCGKEMDLYEKDTSSGRDMRTYVCRQCKEYVDVDNGIALWQVLHDAREKETKPGNDLKQDAEGNGE